MIIGEGYSVWIHQEHRNRALEGLKDYKFFAFDGVVKALYINTNRERGDTRSDYFDINFKHLPFECGYPNAYLTPRKPHSFNKMKEMTEMISKGLPHLRVDFYEVNNKVYFGELTFYSWSGFMPFIPTEWDRVFGDWIMIPELEQ